MLTLAYSSMTLDQLLCASVLLHAGYQTDLGQAYYAACSKLPIEQQQQQQQIPAIAYIKQSGETHVLCCQVCVYTVESCFTDTPEIWTSIIMWTLQRS